MRDGKTRRHVRKENAGGMKDFLAGRTVKIVVMTGASAGQSFNIDRERVTMGRGPGVDFAVDNPEMSRQHAAIEYSARNFQIRDLGSTNGIFINGKHVQAGAIRHGDRFEMGSQKFQLVIEEKDEAPDTYELTPGM